MCFVSVQACISYVCFVSVFRQPIAEMVSSGVTMVRALWPSGYVMDSMTVPRSTTRTSWKKTRTTAVSLSARPDAIDRTLESKNTLSLSVCLFLSVCLCLSLSLSLKYTLSYTHSLTLFWNQYNYRPVWKQRRFKVIFSLNISVTNLPMSRSVNITWCKFYSR